MLKEEYQLDLEQTQKYLAQKWDNIDDKLPEIPKGFYTFQPSDPQILLYYKRLLYLLSNYEQPMVEKAWALSKYLLDLNTNNYYAMIIRNKCRAQLWEKLSKQDYFKRVSQQLEFTNGLLAKNSKQYQIWNYKKDIIGDALSRIAQVSQQELRKNQEQFLFQLMTHDEQKNYHAWDYMTWLSRAFGNLQQSIKKTQSMIFSDHNLNSPDLQYHTIWKNCYPCWSYRFHLIMDLPEDKKALYVRQDCEKVHSFVLMNPQSECAWNYLKGMLQLEDVDPTKKTEIIKHIYEVCKISKNNRYAWSFLLQLGSEEMRTQALDSLIKIDPIRSLYYQFLKEQQYKA